MATNLIGPDITIMSYFTLTTILAPEELVRASALFYQQLMHDQS